ncbi:MAG: cytochrome C oxidase subunit IV family protein [Bacteroidetes bacterium]|nr:cytochrome C oxidase subunit IV family protein [Bacteroidota bacterium]
MAHMTQEEYKQNVKDVYKTTLILSVVTILEVSLALLYEYKLMEAMSLPRWPLMVFVTVMSLVKAYWIMKVFMHVGHEKKGFVFTLLFPFVFLVWYILSFAYDGFAYYQLREFVYTIFF